MNFVLMVANVALSALNFMFFATSGAGINLAAGIICALVAVFMMMVIVSTNG